MVKRHLLGAAAQRNEATGPTSHPSMLRFFFHEADSLILGALWYVGYAIDIVREQLRELERERDQDADQEAGRWPPEGFV